MGFQINIDSNKQKATILGTGHTDAAGFRDILLKAVADPSFRVGYGILVDARSLDYTPTIDETKQFTEFHISNDTLKRSKVAVVVTKVVDYGMANMFSTLCEMKGATVRSFQSVTEAECWLTQG